LIVIHLHDVVLNKTRISDVMRYHGYLILVPCKCQLYSS